MLTSDSSLQTIQDDDVAAIDQIGQIYANLKAELGKVIIMGKTFHLDEPFFMLATQNPVNPFPRPSVQQTLVSGAARQKQIPSNQFLAI